ncbi:MAG: hemolysin D [Planctomycetota bacterium]|jgi:putative peptide zinc metalloprotease protein
MATLADSLVSSSDRKLPIRRRGDLSARRQRYLGRSYWIVKDPVGLNYFRFQEEEFAILQMLNGDVSLNDVKDRFEAEFPPQKITLDELQQFLGQLHRSGLIVAGVPGQGRQLHKRRKERRRKEVLAAMTNILCIRFKGVDPERFLNWLYPKMRWVFSPVLFYGGVFLTFSALLLILVRFDVFRAKLPGFYQFFSPTNALLLAVSLAVTKVIHEIGHGLTCKHYQGECHEIGVMILVLTPCLYCNVSDSWMLPNKWHRAAIGAAGIFVEVGMAAAATFVWWCTEEGLLHYLALNVMFICSVSTILFNGNPLLRYDGYYILSDIVEIPNLRQKASTVLSRKMGQWFLGLEPPEDPFLPQRNQVLFMLYTVAAVLYRWFILLSILMFLYKVFEPYGLKIIGQLIAAMALWGLIFQPMYKLCKFFYVPGRWHKVKKPRMYLTLAVLAGLVFVFLYVKLPYSVMCPLEIQARDEASVYVAVPGTLEHDKLYKKPGDRVSKGDLLAELTNVDLEAEIKRLEGERDQLDLRLKNLKGQLRFENPEVAARIEETDKALQSKEEQLAERIRDHRRLQLRAPRDGVVLPPPWIPKRDPVEAQLPSWHGTPLEPRNLGCYLEKGVTFCRIGELEHMEAILVIDQDDVDFVAAGQEVEIKLDELPHDTFLDHQLDGKRVNLTIDKVASDALKTPSRRMGTKSGGDLPTETDPDTGVEKTQSPSYQARVFLENPHGLLRLGLLGRAKIHVAPQSLGRRCWRFLTRTFNFEL